MIKAMKSEKTEKTIKKCYYYRTTQSNEVLNLKS